MQSNSNSCRILINLEFRRQIFEKCLNINFHKNPDSGSRFVQCERTDGRKDGRADGGTDGHPDRHDEANFAFRHFAKAPKNPF
jgi:hypothetical protein